MPAEIIVGICRFSYLGRSDWAQFRRNKSTDAERLADIAKDLFDEARLASRFLAFETICLPSILEQKDPRFIFLLVSSPLMPEHWRKRLHALCDPHDQIQILWSDAPTLAEALEQPLTELYDLSDGNLWQFRLDDDDAIDAEFMLRLRRNMARMEGIDECAITSARGVHVALYQGQPKRFLEFRQAFWGAGLALKLKQPGLSIFRYGHFGLRERFTHFVDHEHYAALILKWESDSVPLNFDRLPLHTTLIDENLFERHLAAHFPFLEGVDFDILRRKIEPDSPLPQDSPEPIAPALDVGMKGADVPDPQTELPAKSRAKAQGKAGSQDAKQTDLQDPAGQAKDKRARNRQGKEKQAQKNQAQKNQSQKNRNRARSALLIADAPVQSDPSGQTAENPQAQDNKRSRNHSDGQKCNQTNGKKDGGPRSARNKPTQASE